MPKHILGFTFRKGYSIDLNPVRGDEASTIVCMHKNGVRAGPKLKISLVWNTILNFAFNKGST